MRDKTNKLDYIHHMSLCVRYVKNLNNLRNNTIMRKSWYLFLESFEICENPFSKGIEEGIIEPKDLISLIIYLKVASRCENSDEYFMLTSL